ncbi:MAG: general secretion pathway protein GspK, partial [Bdellovibrionales bacterium]|nr:general secretion pathway protein GspK [Bdellovibrionales bacterium]
MIKDLKVILKNESGVALMMIMTAIILLMAIYGEFTFESKIARIKATNVMDRSQAKLLAESGLQMAMTRLKLYKEAFNKLESNSAAKGQVPPQLLNQLWEVPFMFPIPVGEGANLALKETVKKFTEDSLLEGSMRVTVTNISNRMNLNLLRLDTSKIKAPVEGQDPEENPNDGIVDTSPTAINSNVSIDQSLYFLMKRLVDEKKEKDEAFEDRYANLNYQELVSNLKFYMSDYQSLMSDPMAGEAEASFQRIPLTPKYGPLSSASELYAIPGWNDELIELIQNEFSVYPSAQIDLNKLTANMLRILVPNIDEEQIRSFFEYRDNPEEPKFFNTVDDFKKWVTEVEKIMNENDFKDRIEKFTKAGITFGSNPNLFKVVCEGIQNRSTYTLVAYVYMPKQETAAGAPPVDQNLDGDNNPNTPTPVAAPAQTTQLLEPRIIELQ